MQHKLRCKKIYLAVDGDDYFKCTLDPAYKTGSHTIDNDEIVSQIIEISLTLSDYNVIMDRSLEADDVSYCFCRDNNHCVCLSEDRDWAYNLTANTDIKLYQQKTLIHRSNFQNHFGYPVDRIGLALFLQGDAKDGVKKPFRIQGKLVENVLRYDSINDYVADRKLDKQDISHYLELLLPITNRRYGIRTGKRNSKTLDYISQNRMSFLKATQGLT